LDLGGYLEGGKNLIQYLLLVITSKMDHLHLIK
jgi:hypothetical protein